MNTEKNKRKVLIVSLLVFLTCGGAVFTFFTFKGLEDLKGNPNLAFEYDSFPKKAVLPFLKYMGLVDTETVSVSNTAASGAGEDPFAVIKDEAPAAADAPAPKGLNAAGSGRRGGSGKPYYPSSKLSSSMSGAGAAGSGGTKTGFNSSNFSGSGGKGISSGKAGDFYKVGGDSKDIMARVKGTQAIMLASLKSGSADGAKAKWDQGFAGSGSGKASSMFYGGGATKLDNFDAKPEDLKLADTSGLTAPEPGEPEEDKAAEAADPLMQKAQEAAASMANSIASGLSNALAGAMTGGGSSGSGGSGAPGADPLDNEAVNRAAEGMSLNSDTKATLTYNKVSGDYTVTYKGTDAMGPYIDTFRLDKNGNILSGSYGGQ